VERAHHPGRRGHPGRWGSVLAAGALLVLAAPAGAQSQWDALAYGSAVSYAESRVRSDGWAAGFYGTYGVGYRHLVELGGAWTGIDNQDGSTLSQTDVALAYSLFGSRAAGRIGGHVIATSDPLTDGGRVLFGGLSLYRLGVWSAGAELAWSSYPDHGGGLDVLQAAPSAGFTAYAGDDGVVAGTVRGYVIHLSEESGLGATEFFSAEASVSYTLGDWTVSGFAWGGEQAFAVRNGGFLVFNFSELHNGGFGGGLRWVMTPRSALAAGLYMERFRDTGFAGDAWARTLSLSLGLTL
jgi:hypothetical protein